MKDTEWWWIDYLESEFDPSLERDMERLLEHSEEDRESFENFRLLRQWVRESDPAADFELELDERLSLLRSRLASVLEESEGRTHSSGL